MNVTHKKEIKRIYGELEQAKADLEHLHATLEEVMEDKSDKWKEGEAGEEAQAELDNLQECIDEIESAYDKIHEYTT